MRNFIYFFYNIIKVALIAVIGGLVTAPSVSGWYSTVNKPTFNPPNWLFGPVWTILFFLMALSAFIAWETGEDKKYLAKSLALYNFQLGLNLLWSILFFGFKSPTIAFVEIIFLWFSILYTIIRFKKINKLSAILLIPYLLWVTFAAFLNLTIVLLN
jgi:benzodiazapine receptor